MANEAVLIWKNSEPANFIVADSVAITKGQLLKLTDPMTASDASSANDIIAGVAAADKIANSGVTEVGVFMPGQGNIFRMVVSGAATIVAGEIMSAFGDHNLIQGNNTLGSGTGLSKIVGFALETTSADGQTMLVRT